MNELEKVVNANAAIKNYANVKVNAAIESASSHQLITMLLDGLLERISQIKGAIDQKNIELKGKKVNQAVSILFGLRDSLNKEVGGELPERLDNLYEYMQRRIREAHIKNDTTILDECYQLTVEISSGWKAIENQ